MTKAQTQEAWDVINQSRLIDEEINKKVLNQIINPTINALKDLK